MLLPKQVPPVVRRIQFVGVAEARSTIRPSQEEEFKEWNCVKLKKHGTGADFKTVLAYKVKGGGGWQLTDYEC
jgi:hypothetical protein